MNILIAPDSFKHSLRALEVARALKRGIESVSPGHNIMLHPLADGGEGTLDALMHVLKGEYVACQVKDPLMRTIPARFGIIENGRTAILEMAEASGIEKLKTEELDPLRASSFGTGQLIRSALDHGVKKIILGIGGSATNDGGVGMARALGVRFLDDSGKDLSPSAAEICRIERIDSSLLDQRLIHAEVIVACDVRNTITGEQGATRVYAPQKGASPENIVRLEANLKHLTRLIKKQYKLDLNRIPGTGAAGGLLAGLMGYCSVKIEPGFGFIAALSRLEEGIRKSDLVITGEGRIDAQSLMGKAIGGVASLCISHKKRLFAVGAQVEEGIEDKLDGIETVIPLSNHKIPVEESIRKVNQLLVETGARIAKML